MNDNYYKLETLYQNKSMEPIRRVKRLGSADGASGSLTDLRTHTPIVSNLIQMLPSGHDKALKYAFYNVIALVLAGGSILALWAVYCVLEPFIKSLMWALLCGSVLYPFKSRLVAAAQFWMDKTKDSSVPFTIYVATSPLIIADSLSDNIGNYVWTYWKKIGGGMALFMVTYVIYYNPPVTLGIALKWIATTGISLSGTVLGWIRGDIILALIVVYGALVFKTVFASRKKEQQTEISETETSEPTSGEPLKESSKDETDDKKKAEMSKFTSASTEQEGFILRILSILLWTLGILYLCRNMPYTILIPFLICMGAGTVTYFRQKSRQSNYTIPRISMLATKLVLSIGHGQRNNKPYPLTRSQSVDTMNLSFLRGLVGTPKRTPMKVRGSFSAAPVVNLTKESDSPSAEKNVGLDDSSSSAIDEVDYASAVDSNTFLYVVFLACVVVQVWQHLWLLHLLPIPVVYYGIKKLCFRLGIVDFVNTSVVKAFADFYTDSNNELSENVFPTPVRDFLKILSIADKKLCEFCGAYLDPVASMVILITVLLLTILAFLFAGTQVYLEGDHLVRVSVDLINTTVSQHPEINQLLPEGWESYMGSIMDNAYVYGKEYLSNTIRDSIEERDPQKARDIEKQVIEIWDRMYMSWNKTWDGAFNASSSNKIIGGGGNGNSEEGSGIEWNELLETGKSSVPLLFEYKVLVNYAKANFGTLKTLLESIWNILVGNINIAVSAVTSILYLLFGGGFAIVNLILNLVVFITALFYLLNSSTTAYKPVEVFRSSIPGDGKHSSRFLCAVEDAVNGVFTASFKMALFYGLWTWLIHSLFQINIVFVPSFLAALFGAVPLLMPYWAALPAVLELIFIQGEWTLAVLMMCAQMAPMSCVDTQIYSEISGGGHPYLTGLSVAGGIFYFGIQGAIIGPVILCCFVVAVKMASSFLLEEDAIDSQSQQGQGVTQKLLRDETSTPT